MNQKPTGRPSSSDQIIRDIKRKTRVILRKLLGPINLRPGPDGSLWAEYETRPAALLNVGTAGARTDGSGGPLQ